MSFPFSSSSLFWLQGFFSYALNFSYASKFQVFYWQQIPYIFPAPLSASISNKILAPLLMLTTFSQKLFICSKLQLYSWSCINKFSTSFQLPFLPTNLSHFNKPLAPPLMQTNFTHTLQTSVPPQQAWQTPTLSQRLFSQQTSASTPTNINTSIFPAFPQTPPPATNLSLLPPTRAPSRDLSWNPQMMCVREATIIQLVEAFPGGCL